MKEMTLRFKLVLAFAGIVFLNLLASFYYAFQVKAMISFNQTAQNEYSNVRDISGMISTASSKMTRYIQSPTASVLGEYIQAKEEATSLIAALDTIEHSNNEWYMVHAIENSTETMFQKFDHSISVLTAEEPRYFDDYYAGQKILKYIPGYINEYLNLLVEKNGAESSVLEKKTDNADKLSKLFLLCSCLVCLIFAFMFSDMVTKPIRRLSDAAKQISAGKTKIPDVPVANNDEIGAMTKTFNAMKNDIDASIETLKEHSQLEGKLHEEELINLKNTELLKEAQYLALQSQINPHFLFNALNAVAQAIAHEPKETAVKLVCSLADMFRYNLYHLNTVSTLGEELQVVERYMYIQKHRFEDRIDYRVDVDDRFKKVQVPSMLVQPLVENSFIHGIENLEHGGLIFVTAKRSKNLLRIRVYDNGAGMKKEVRERIFSETGQKHIGHTTGIGLSNLRERVSLIKGSTMKIYSAPGRGTLVEIRIPIEEEEIADV